MDGASVVEVDVDELVVLVGAGTVVELDDVVVGPVVVVVLVSGGIVGGASPGAGSLNGTAALDPPLT